LPGATCFNGAEAIGLGKRRWELSLKRRTVASMGPRPSASENGAREKPAPAGILPQSRESYSVNARETANATTLLSSKHQQLPDF